VIEGCAVEGQGGQPRTNGSGLPAEGVAARRYRQPVPSYIIRVELRRADFPPHQQDLTAAPHHAQWRLSWTVERNGRSEELHMTHATEGAACRHAGNLVTRRPPGKAVADVCVDDLERRLRALGDDRGVSITQP
jgi:hypothetical protein